MRRLRRGDNNIEKIAFKDEWEEMCPIFIEKNHNYEHIGTGVLISIWNNTYLLTAAHVIDFLYESKEELYVPNNDGIFIKIDGELFHNPLTYKQKRKDDKIDFSYYKLKKEMVVNINKMFKPLAEEQICFSTNFLSSVPVILSKKFENKRASSVKNSIRENLKDIETWDKDKVKYYNDLQIQNRIIFAGYPLAKTKRHNAITSGELVYYTGGAAYNEIYDSENLNENINILATFGKNGSYKEGVGFVSPPKPYGISGGGIYKVVRTKDGFDRELIGIGHTYLNKKNLFIGTNISHCLQLIKSEKLMSYEAHNRLTSMAETLYLHLKI